MQIFLKNNLGIAKESTVGFSWKFGFFGMFLPLFQGRIKWFFITTLISCTIIGYFVLPFIYNKLYIKSLLKNGYYPSDEQTKTILSSYGIFAETINERNDLSPKA